MLRIEALEAREEDVRDRSSLFIMPKHPTHPTKHILRELLTQELVNLELLSPFESCDEHGLCFLDIELSDTIHNVVK